MSHHYKPKSTDARRGPSIDQILSSMDSATPIEANPEECWDRHHAIAQLIVAGLNNKQIAARIGCTPQTVSNVRNSPVARAQISRLRGEQEDEVIQAHKLLRDAACDAAQRLVDCVQKENADEKLQTDVAFKVLGLAGIVPPKNVNIRGEHKHAVLTADQIVALRDRGQIVRGLEDSVVEEVENSEID